MRLEELKNDLPETPDFIHNMIQEEVARQTKATNIFPMKKKNKYKWSMGRVAAAVVACIVATSSVAYAGTRLYHMYLEKQGTYSVITGIQASEDGNSLKLPKQIHDITITSSYIPDGMEWTEEGSKLNYTDTPQQGGISISSVLMDKKDLSEVLLDKNVVDSEEHVFGEYEGVYLAYHDLQQDLSFNQRIYLLCPEQYRVLTIYIGDDVSKEDAFQFAEGIVITENDTMIDTTGLYTWSDIVNPDIMTGKIPVTNGKVPIHEIGDTFGLGSGYADGDFIDPDSVTVCVDSVQFADDLQLIDANCIPDEWKNAVGEDGKLVSNHLSYIKSGDGIETLDDVVAERDVNQKLVYATVTYKNTTNKQINHLLYNGSLMTIAKQSDGTYTVYVDGETPGEGYDRYIGDGVARTAEMTYFTMQEDYGNGGNYISLKPGESIKINMAWIVNEQDIKNMYLNLNGTGCSYEFDDAIMENGLVYIGK